MSAVATMPQLAFAVVDAAPVEHAAVPTLSFALQITAHGVEDDPLGAARHPDPDRSAPARVRRRGEGEPHRAVRAARELGHDAAHAAVGAHDARSCRRSTARRSSTCRSSCTYDFEVAASRYLDALDDGDVPLELLFSGAVFYAGADGRLQTIRISWEAEADYRLPVAVWRSVMHRHFPDTAWLRLGRAQFDRLLAFRSQRSLGSWDAAVDALLDEGPR